MKKTFIILSAASILFVGFSSCKKILSTIFPGVDVSVPDMQVTIPAIFVVAPSEISLGSFSYPFNLDSVVKAKTSGIYGAKDVVSIKIKQVNVSITDADQLNNLANFESARVTIQSNTNNTPAELFSTTFPDTYAASFTNTPTNGQELLSYLKGSNIIYTMYGKNRRITTKPLTLVFSVTIRAN